MVTVSVYIGATCGPGVLSRACDVLEMSVVGGVGSEWVRGLGTGFTNPGGTGGKWGLCFGCGGVVGGGSGWAAWARVWESGVVLSLYLV